MYITIATQVRINITYFRLFLGLDFIIYIINEKRSTDYQNSSKEEGISKEIWFN